MAELRLWKYNRVTGIWDYVRTVTPETRAAWLERWSKDEPGETFRVSARQPITPAMRQLRRQSRAR